MTATLKAIYEEGNMLRLLAPLSLERGEEVEVTINSNKLAEMERNAPDPSRVAEIIAEIAALAVPRGEPDLGGRDHDLILYGGPEGAR